MPPTFFFSYLFHLCFKDNSSVNHVANAMLPSLIRILHGLFLSCE